MLHDTSLDLRSYWLEKGWPDDAAFIASLAEFPIYLRERKKCRLLLERLEGDEGHPEAVNTKNLNIEHVLPQTVASDDVGRSWQVALGSARWEQEHEKWVHTLGNLTLTGINSELGNNAFAAKQAMFADSNVSLNEHFAGISLWNGIEIQARGVEFGRRIAKIWPRPDGEPYIARGPDAEEIFEEKFDSPSEPNERQPHIRGNLKVTIRWSLLGVDAPDETICERSAALTHATFIGRLIANFGAEMSDRLQRIPVARSYSLSDSPEKDFINPNQGVPYNHKLVPGTSLFIFTSSETPEKKSHIIELCAKLRFPPGGVEVT